MPYTIKTLTGINTITTVSIFQPGQEGFLPPARLSLKQEDNHEFWYLSFEYGKTIDEPIYEKLQNLQSLFLSLNDNHRTTLTQFTGANLELVNLILEEWPQYIQAILSATGISYAN